MKRSPLIRDLRYLVKNGAKKLRGAAPDAVTFTCNICGKQTATAQSELGRESGQCDYCTSTVRLRALVHHVVKATTGESVPLPSLKRRDDIRGVGLSDWYIYGDELAKRFAYTNTWYHQEPRLDITAPQPEHHGAYDFMISADVFEHIPPPGDRAFTGAAQILKPGGLLVMTIPYTKAPETTEHFPDGTDFDLRKVGDNYELHWTDADGKPTVSKDLVFHGDSATPSSTGSTALMTSLPNSPLPASPTSRSMTNPCSNSVSPGRKTSRCRSLRENPDQRPKNTSAPGVRPGALFVSVCSRNRRTGLRVTRSKPQ